ncbi:MAG: FAD:protein FMN transferase [Clostridiales bacterium]|nr:FAD:protein FMN transferase [Clostridiales bacterium]
MKFIKKLFAVILALSITLSLFACENRGSAFDFTCFNTYIHIQTATKPISKDTENKIKSTFFELESEFDANKENSIVYRFNNGLKNTPITLSDKAVEIFTQVDTAYAFTQGGFDPTVYPLVKLWGFAPYKLTVNFTPPTIEQINTAKAKIGYEKLCFDKENKTLTKLDDFVKLDLGGIVKGYAADLAALILQNSGYTDGYVSVGGSSLNLLKVDTLSIRHPRKTNEHIIKVLCGNDKNISLSTSGDYERYHLGADGKKYCHIIDTKTGAPTTTGVASVTVMGVSGALSDAFTTAGCLLSYDNDNHESSPLTIYLKNIITTYDGAKVFAVISTENDKIILTNAKTDDFTLNDNDYLIKSL